MSEYRVIGSDINRQQLAGRLGVTRMTLYNWLKNPDKMPLGAYKRLKALGFEADDTGEIIKVMKCEACNGTGLHFITATPPIKGKEPTHE